MNKSNWDLLPNKLLLACFLIKQADSHIIVSSSFFFSTRAVATPTTGADTATAPPPPEPTCKMHTSLIRNCLEEIDEILEYRNLILAK